MRRVHTAIAKDDPRRHPAQPFDETLPGDTPLAEGAVSLVLVACWVAIIAMALLGCAPRAAAADRQPTLADEIALGSFIEANESLRAHAPGGSRT